MRRKTLTHNLRIFMERVNSLILPVTITKVFVHGSYIRGEDLPGDLDLILLANLKDEWSKWYQSFSTLREYHNLLWDCYERDMTFEDVVYGPLAPEIERRDISKDWVATMSWSEIFGWTGFGLSYSLSWENITRKLLTKGMKGIHPMIKTLQEQITPVMGRVHLYREIPVFLIWDIETPEDCILEPTPKEYEAYLKLENVKLNESIADMRFLVAIGRFYIERSLLHIPEEKWGEIALKVFWNTRRYEASESELREILKKIGIPEHRVYTVKRRGQRTWYRLPKTVEEEKELKDRLETWNTMNEVETRVLKIMRKLVPKTEGIKIDCYVESLEDSKIGLRVSKPPTLSIRSFRDVWEPRGFEIRQYFGSSYAEKVLLLPLNLNESEVKEILKKSLVGG